MVLTLGTNIIEKNANRWNILPAGKHRVNIRHLLKLNSFFFKVVYNYFSIKWKSERAWEHERYSILFKGRKVLEVGSGLGFDSLNYTKSTCSYTHAELNTEQLEILKKVHAVFKTSSTINFELLDKPFTHVFKNKFNAFYAHGVLHHIPFEDAKKEFENIDKYLEVNSIVVLLMYPKARWIDAGSPPFESFGNSTDGGCPWAEYYDEDKILKLVGPNYKLKESIYWGRNKSEFVNFELEKVY